MGTPSPAMVRRLLEETLAPLSAAPAPATKRNLHVLIVKEGGLVVETGAYSTHRDALAGWVDFVVGAATPETALDEELRALSLKCDRGPDVTVRELIDRGISHIDLIDWWITRQEDNEVRFFEVKNRT